MHQTEKTKIIVLLIAFVIGLVLLLIFSSWHATLDRVGLALMLPMIFLCLTLIVGKFTMSRPKIGRILKKISRMKTELRMIGISLHDFHEHSDEFKSIINKCVNSKGLLKFKFLFHNPESKYLTQREIEEEGEGTGRLKREILKTQKKLAGLKAAFESESNIEWEYGIYDTMPRYSIIWIDTEMFIGPYMLGKKGTESVWVRTKEGEKDYGAYKKYFEKLWEQRKPFRNP